MNCYFLGISLIRIINFLLYKLLGKGENIWDRLTHINPNFVSNNDNGDIACNSYYLYKEDVKLIKNIGVSKLSQNNCPILNR